jgi:hypothetical protein
MGNTRRRHNGHGISGGERELEVGGEGRVIESRSIQWSLAEGQDFTLSF